jgi:tetratricopeptide (TPR) repeat protein
VSHETALDLVERGDFPAAREVLRDVEAAGDVWLTAAWIELERGNARGCSDALAEAVALGASTARVRCLDGLRLCGSGSYAVAVDELSGAVEELRDDPRWLANGLVGRGIALAYLLRLAEAERDFQAAKEIYARIGEEVRVSICVHNLGFVALQGGDVPRALALFDAASGGLRKGRAEALIDRASALAAAGMARDASAVLDEAERLLAGRPSQLAEAALTAGYCALRLADLELAGREARRAQELFSRQGRTGWVAAADALALRIEFTARAKSVGRQCRCAARETMDTPTLSGGTPAASLSGGEDQQGFVGWESVRMGRSLGGHSDGSGLCGDCEWWATRVAGAWRVVRRCFRWGRRVEAAELILATGDAGLMRILERERTADTAPLRALGWLARARLATDRRQLFAACRAGMRESEDLAEEFVHSALRVARRPRGVLEWLEPGVDLAAFGARVLVRFVVHEGRLMACSVVDGRVRVHRLGEDPSGAIKSFRMRLKAGQSYDQGLDRQLFGDIDLGDRELVVVPARGMSGLVWGALPSCQGRAVSVVPSADVWVRARVTDERVKRISVVGPGLVHAEREVRALGHQVFTTTVEGALAGMEGADLAHVVAHGTFREDAPLFSYVRLADGDLHIHDLQRLDRTPRVLILAACEVARAEAVAAIVLKRGTQVVVASTLPVPDRQAVTLVGEFGRLLDQGLAPAEALALAQTRRGHLGFSCFGAG